MTVMEQIQQPVHKVPGWCWCTPPFQILSSYCYTDMMFPFFIWVIGLKSRSKRIPSRRKHQNPQVSFTKGICSFRESFIEQIGFLHSSYKWDPNSCLGLRWQWVGLANISPTKWTYPVKKEEVGRLNVLTSRSAITTNIENMSRK